MKRYHKIAECILSLEAPFDTIESKNFSVYRMNKDENPHNDKSNHYNPAEEEIIDFAFSFQPIDSFCDIIKKEEVVSEDYYYSVLLSGGKEYRNFTIQNYSYAITEIMEEKGISYYEYQGEGILFTAPSGTGKSTHAYLWIRHYGATLVNGDRAVICKKNGIFHVFGLPMCGSSDTYHNITSPLKCIVILRQSPTNYVEIMGAMDIFHCLYSECTVNSWNTSYVEKVFEIIDAIIEEVPVYLLHCNMEKGAADCLHEFIYETLDHMLPYKDLYTLSGPSIYLFMTIGYLFGGRSGIFLIQALGIILSALLIFKLCAKKEIRYQLLTWGLFLFV